jgi:hypothetical protein
MLYTLLSKIKAQPLCLIIPYRGMAVPKEVIYGHWGFFVTPTFQTFN